MYREWSDPRDAVTWLVQVFYGTSEDAFGRPKAIPRMITFRLPIDVDLAAVEVHSAPLDGTVQLHDLTNEQLALQLDVARALGRDPRGPVR